METTWILSGRGKTARDTRVTLYWDFGADPLSWLSGLYLVPRQSAVPKFVFSLTSSICNAAATRGDHILRTHGLTTLVCAVSVLELETNLYHTTE